MAVLRDNYVRRFSLMEVIDGDTVIVLVDLGMGDQTVKRIRLLGINAAERFKGAPEERAKGAEAKQALSGWLAEHVAHTLAANKTKGGMPFIVATQKGQEKYGRWLGAITCGQGHSANHWMLDAGHALPYLTPVGEW